MAPPRPPEAQEAQPQAAPSSDGQQQGGTSLEDEASVREQAAEQSLREEKPRGQAPATSQEAAPETAQRQESAPAPAQPAQPAPAGDSGAGAGDAAAYVTPLVRKLAAENGVDLGSLKGTGVGGRIRKQDVLSAAEEAKKAQSAPAARPRLPLPPAAVARPPRRCRPSAAPPRR